MIGIININVGNVCRGINNVNGGVPVGVENELIIAILITLALVTGGYSLTIVLHLSGPIAIVVAGLLIGNRGRLLAMSEETHQHLDIFWELVDEVLDALLFVLIGLEVLVLTFTQHYLLAILLIIPAVLLSRFIAMGHSSHCFALSGSSVRAPSGS